MSDARQRWDRIALDVLIASAGVPNMRVLTLFIIAALLGPQNTQPSVEQKTTPPYRAESSAYVIEGKDAWTYVTENRSFRFEEVLGDTGNYETLLLLEETFYNERTPGIEARMERLRLTPGLRKMDSNASYAGLYRLGAMKVT